MCPYVLISVRIQQYGGVLRVLQLNNPAPWRYSRG